MDVKVLFVISKQVQKIYRGVKNHVKFCMHNFHPNLVNDIETIVQWPITFSAPLFQDHE